MVDGAGSASFRRGREWSQRAAALREDSAFLDVFEQGAFLLNVCGPGLRRGIESSSVDSRLPTRVDEGTLVMVEGALEFVDAVAWARVRLLNHLGVLPLARSVDALVAGMRTVVVPTRDSLRIADVLEAGLPGIGARTPAPVAGCAIRSVPGRSVSESPRTRLHVLRELAAITEFAEVMTSRAESQVEQWCKVVDRIPVDASSANLSGMSLYERSALLGVVWSESTMWPPHVEDWVRARSRRVDRDCYQILEDENPGCERVMTLS